MPRPGTSRCWAARRCELPAGEVPQALHLQREPTRPYDTRVEVWLDPARQHLPVRVVFTTLPGGQPLGHATLEIDEPACTQVVEQEVPPCRCSTTRTASRCCRSSSACPMAQAEGGSRGGYEIVDKFARKGIFIEGAVAQSFKDGVQALIDSGPTEEALDDYIAGYTTLAQQPMHLH